MKRFSVNLIFAVLLISLTNIVFGQQERWIAFDPTIAVGTPPDIEVIRSDENQTVVNVKIYGMWSRDVYEKRTRFQSLYLPNYTTTSEIGKAAMPTIRGLIGIISDADTAGVVKVSIRDSLYYDGFNVFPYLKPIAEDSLPRFKMDSTFYNTDAYYPSVFGKVGSIGEWGYLRVGNLEIYPIRVNPARRTIVAYSELELTVTHPGPIQYLHPLSPFWLKMYEPVIINGPLIWKYFPKWPYWYLRAKYLIITADRFVKNIMPLATWKVMKGLDVTIVKVSTIGATDTAIRNYIRDFYDDNPCYRIYVLLVGDVGDIPVHYYYPGPFNPDIASDHYYACVRGSDDYPDLYIGRISAIDDASVSHIVDKILRYDKKLQPWGNWVKKILLVAHKQGYPGKYTKCKEEIRTYPYGWLIPIFDTAYGGIPGVDNSTVINAINAGRGIVNYRGHGNESCWQHWNNPGGWGQNFTKTDVSGLSNDGYTPIVYSITCRNNWIDWNNDCIGETWLKSCKAVAHLGATRSSPTGVNHNFDKYLFKATYDHGITEIGRVMNYAKSRILSLYPPGNFYAESEARMYLLLGDPEMSIRTKSFPWQLAVVYPSWIPELVKQPFPVKVEYAGVPVKNAVVCLWKEGDIHVNAYTDENGIATFDIEPSSTGTMYVTVTKEAFKPYLGKAVVITTPGFQLAVDKVLTWPGRENVFVPVFLTNPDSVGGWEVLMQYDTSRCTIVGATLCDSIYIPEDEKWYYAPWAGNNKLKPEYFNYVLNVWGHAERFRIVGIMNMDNPTPVVPDIVPGEKQLLFCIIANVNSEWDGQDIVFDFYTGDCTDNILSSSDGYTVWGPDSSSVPSETCPDRPDSLKAVNLAGGSGIGFLEVIAGDINLNGVPYEVGDAIVFVNYLVHGPGILVDPPRQTFASDVNKDGYPWTVADLVTIINVINGYLPIPKKPSSQSTEPVAVNISKITNGETMISTASTVPLGGAYFVLKYDQEKTKLGTPVLAELGHAMILSSESEDGMLRILLYSLEGHVIHAASGTLFTIPVVGEDNVILHKVDIADATGTLLKVQSINQTMSEQLPTIFSLAQNYPNPFNAQTTISFALPKTTNVNLKIYNIEGQLVKTLVNKRVEAGNHTVHWNGKDSSDRDVSSGIYFYKIIASDFNMTRKMVVTK